ncbi:granulocyte colony-stimulating factor-like [Gambusia affinis]|uniref:granulocyte colony-stimulating factor-like n=1 Tax=Gambusia affinis TaxID=33528 RepID=UPI001CDC193D|nr:granulocyte colony-stimulating factor-like [Gambusia affinis]
MDTWTVIILLQYFLFGSLVRSAPVSLLSNLPPAFRETAVEAKTLSEKILTDISAAHAATVKDFSLDSSTSNLQLMAASMEIPSSPVLQALSPHFTLETCVSRMLAGVQMYQNLLEVLSSKVSGLDDLRADLRDLLTHINKLKEGAQLIVDVSDQNLSTNLASYLQDSHNVQVALRLTLTQLRSFCHDLIRTFRVLSRPRAAGAR